MFFLLLLPRLRTIVDEDGSCNGVVAGDKSLLKNKKNKKIYFREMKDNKDH